ncbi:MAG: cytidylyltransferase domain-containing protein [Candidatus Nanopelagicales bacterium]
MSTLAIVQARMTSTRFPGKVLAPLAGEPMVLRQVERIQRATTLDGLVVATSTDVSDDRLVQVLDDAGIPVVRGSLDDVLERFVTAIDALAPDVVVRLTADCPLISPAVIDRVVEAFGASGADYASNTMSPTYPDGLDVEVVRADVLREVARIATDPPEREHVTLGVYRRPDRYRIENVAGERDLSDLRWTVDTPEDYEFVRAVYEDLLPVKADFDVDDVIAYLERHPGRARTAAHAERNAALRGIGTGAMNA